jgi:hypothetical protein
VPDYQHLTDDELLHLAEDRDELTDDARFTLDAELSQRRLSSSDIDSYRTERLAVENAEKLKHAPRPLIPDVGLGKKFYGKTNRRRDPEGNFEQYAATLWFIVFWFPVFPIATYTVRREFERWWGGVSASEEIPIERHPRNWGQILLTWVKATALLFALRIAFLFCIHRAHR